MINSISSKLVTSLTTIRNPQGNEENWLNDHLKYYHLPSGKARLAAETAYALTTIAALIETIVSGSFLILSIPLALVNSKPLQKNIQWLESSAFTIIWSTSYLFLNLNTPNLLTKEDLSRNLALRGDIENTTSWPQAPLFSRLFMIPREIPAYLSTAYALRFKDHQPEKGIFSRLFGKIKRYAQLIREFSNMNESNKKTLTQNLNKFRLESDFEKLNSELATKKRAICAYFVSALDANGAILGDDVYYYHHYKIGRFEKHFDVSAKVVKTTDEMFKHLNDLKATYPDRPIKVVDIVAHGFSQSIDIESPSEKDEENFYHISKVGENEFNACSADAAIIIDACSTGAGNNSIAKKIAEKNPGKRIFAPGTLLFFSKPEFSAQNGIAKVAHVTHGFAIFNAYTSKEFQTT